MSHPPAAPIRRPVQRSWPLVPRDVMIKGDPLVEHFVGTSRMGKPSLRSWGSFLPLHASHQPPSSDRQHRDRRVRKRDGDAAHRGSVGRGRWRHRVGVVPVARRVSRLG